MAEVKPFKGLLYNKSMIGGDYSTVVAPPYDVIPRDMRDELYEKNEHNVIKLILGKSSETDDENNNKYTRARKFMDRWCRQGVLVRDDSESFYIYLQEYEYQGQTCRRVGFMGLMKIEDPGKDTILPHEYTLAKPKEDRMNLIKQVQSNLSPIFALYSDDNRSVTDMLEKTISSSVPVTDIEIGDQKHKLWRLSDTDSIEKISALMKDKKIFIADGHHRYEVARTYRRIRKQESDYDGSADYVMMYFADLVDSDNLTVMATHRVIKQMPDTDEADITARLNKYFDITKSNDLSGLLEQLDNDEGRNHVFGFFNGKEYLFLKA